MSSPKRPPAIRANLLAPLAAAAAVLQLLVGCTPQNAEPRAGAPSQTLSAPPAVPRTASPAPTASDNVPDQAVLAAFEEIEAQVLELRGLEAADIGPPEVISPAQLEDEFAADFAENYPASEREADNVTLQALGLLEPDDDIVELQLEMLSGGVSGFYDDVKKRLVVVTDAGLTGEARVTYAHEYAHALQDENFGIGTLGLEGWEFVSSQVEGGDDGAMARLALVEGDAQLTAILWAQEHLDLDDLLDLGGEPPDVSQFPDWLLETQLFSYTAGVDFVAAIYQQGGFDAVNAAFADPPDSSEQILHPEKYFDREAPVEVEVTDIAESLGAGWEQIESTRMGQATLQFTLDALGADPDGAVQASEGWGGDALVVASGPDESFALAWRFVFDTSTDAQEFLVAYNALVPEIRVPADVEQLTDGSVLVAHASSRRILDRVMLAAR